MLKVADVAELLGISPSLVYELVGKGHIASYRIGLGRGSIRIREEDVQAYLDNCRVEVPQPKTNTVRLKHIRLS